MAKRDSKAGTAAKRTKTGKTGTTGAMEDRVLAFAEQLGWMAGTIQSKTEGWMDRETLQKQVATVRDGATSLLQQLAAGATKGARNAKKRLAPTRKPASAPAPKRSAGRSGGVVDAPGKTHRKPAPVDTGVTRAKSQVAKLQAATPMAKGYQRRARG